VFLLGAVAVLMTTSGAMAITIHDVMSTNFDPGVNDVLATYGSGGYYLTYAPVDGGTGLFNPTGTPGSSGTFQGNPAWLDFFLDSGGGGGGGGGGGSGGGAAFPNTLSYTLTTNLSGPSSFDFSVLFYNPNYDAAVAATTDVAQVILTGSDGTTVDTIGGNEVLVTAGELRAGILLTWSIEADAGVDLNVVINSLGIDAYASGFFLDNVTPEPATLGLLAVGLGGLILRRRRR
jgi:hypothetical protein